jgi:hypothetical protein
MKALAWGATALMPRAATVAVDSMVRLARQVELVADAMARLG